MLALAYYIYSVRKMDVTADGVLAAIRVVVSGGRELGQIDGRPGRVWDLASANAYLSAAAELPEAWTWAASLLSSNDPSVSFFASHLLLSKARAHGAGLAAEERQQLLTFLLSEAIDKPYPKVRYQIAQISRCSPKFMLNAHVYAST